MKVVTAENSERVARYAFEYGKDNLSHPTSNQHMN